MEEDDRGQWGKQMEFILTLVGYAVGLGNVWRFPYLCFQNGGGAFLIPYVISLVLLGIPMFALECAFGQYGGKGPISIWSINPALKGLGMATVASSCIVFIYYDVVIAWALRFLIVSFTSELPWKECKSCDCLLYGIKNVTDDIIEQLKYNNTLNATCDNITVSGTKSPSELYFYNDILGDTGTIEDAGALNWQLLLCNLGSYTVIFLVLLKGIQSLGKVVYFTATFPYVLLTILLVRSAMLDGAYDGVKFYLEPDWERLKDASVWSDAAVQIFFSLSACIGGLIAMSSYNKFNNNIIRDAFVVPIINCLTSFFAGFVVFCTLGNMAYRNNLPIANVTQGGPGLAFVVYPEAIANMPVSTLWSILFFFMICLLGFSTQFSAAETIMTSIIDEFPKTINTTFRKVLFRLSVCFSGFVLGIPLVTEGGSHLLDLVDGAVLGFPLLFIGLLEYVSVIHIYGYNNFARDIETMVGFKPFFYFKATWVVIAPILLLALIVFKAYEMEDFEPAWSGLLYYLIVLFCLMWVPVVYFVYTCRKSVWQDMRPTAEWNKRRDQQKAGDNIEMGDSKIKPSNESNGKGTDNQAYEQED